MNGHTEESLYSTFFSTGEEAARFVRVMRESIRFEAVHRNTPPGSLVIYGPRDMPPTDAATLFVTSGILRAAELMQLRVTKGPKLAGASALPQDIVVLFAHLGGTGTAPRDPEAPNDSTGHSPPCT